MRIEQLLQKGTNAIVLKYFTNQCPSYLNEVFKLACLNNLKTRNSYLKLIYPFGETNTGQNALSFIGPQYEIKSQRFLKKPTTLMLSNIA